MDGTLTADGNSAKTYDLIKRSGYNHEAPDSSREHKTDAYIENCIVESNSTIKANSRYVGENGTRIVVEDSPLYY